jgi:putative membrane protein
MQCEAQEPDAPPLPGVEQVDESGGPAGQVTTSDQAIHPVLQGRLHPLTLLFAFYTSIRKLLLPMIPLLFVGNRTVLGLLIMLTAGSIITRALVRYFTFSYRIEGGELITRQGVFERTERHIPLERVQEVRIEQGVLHRLFGVVEATVETAGGQGPEAQLSVLSRSEAERLRHAVFTGAPRRVAQAVSVAAPADSIQLHSLALRDLMLAGLTSNHLVSALVLVGTLWAFVDDVLPQNFYERVATSVEQAVEGMLQQGAAAAVAVAAVGLVALFIVGALASIIGTVVLFYGFTLSQVGEDLRRSYGLFTRRSSSLPRRRIQVLEVRETLLRRLFRLASLRADTAGGGGQNREEKKGGRDVLLPIAGRDEADALVKAIFPDLEPGPLKWIRVSKLAIIRGAAKGALACVIAAGGMYWYQGGIAGLWPLLFIPVVVCGSALGHRHLGYHLEESYFRTRRGWPGRSTHIVPIRNAQAIAVRQSPLDRTLGLATLVVDTAGQSYTGGGPRIGNIPLDEARRLAKRLGHGAAATRYRW